MALDVKDIMFPGNLKRIFAQVLKAQKGGTRRPGEGQG